MTTTTIEHLIQLLAKLPGLGPRSARRAALHLIKRRDSLARPLAMVMGEVLDNTKTCSICANIDVNDPCLLCTDDRRDDSIICVVEEVADLWALERAAVFRGRYHVLGGTLSALDGIGPEDLNIAGLVDRANANRVVEVVLATSATVDGHTTAHYIADRLADCEVSLSALSHGVPVGGELDYLDDGTLLAALRERKPI